MARKYLDQLYSQREEGSEGLQSEIKFLYFTHTGEMITSVMCINNVIPRTTTKILQLSKNGTPKCSYNLWEDTKMKNKKQKKYIGEKIETGKVKWQT